MGKKSKNHKKADNSYLENANFKNFKTSEEREKL